MGRSIIKENSSSNLVMVYEPPAEYLVKNVSQTVIKILTGFRLS